MFFFSSQTQPIKALKNTFNLHIAHTATVIGSISIPQNVIFFYTEVYLYSENSWLSSL